MREEGYGEESDSEHLWNEDLLDNYGFENRDENRKENCSTSRKPG